MSWSATDGTVIRDGDIIKKFSFDEKRFIKETFNGNVDRYVEWLLGIDEYCDSIGVCLQDRHIDSMWFSGPPTAIEKLKEFLFRNIPCDTFRDVDELEA